MTQHQQYPIRPNRKRGMKEQAQNPIKVNNNVWYYNTKNKLEFTVQTGDKFQLFEISKKRLFNLLKKDYPNLTNKD